MAIEFMVQVRCLNPRTWTQSDRERGFLCLFEGGGSSLANPFLNPKP